MATHAIKMQPQGKSIVSITCLYPALWNTRTAMCTNPYTLCFILHVIITYHSSFIIYKTVSLLTLKR